MPRAAYLTVKKDRGTVIIETPFNQDFKDDLKARCKTAAWNGESWTVDISERRMAESLIKIHYRECPAFSIEGAVTTNLHTGEVI